MTLGEKLRQLRAATGMSQQELAEEAGVSQGTVAKLELDDVGPSVATVRALCRVFSIRDPTELLLLAGRIPEDVRRYLLTNPDAVETVREMARGGGGIRDG